MHEDYGKKRADPWSALQGGGVLEKVCLFVAVFLLCPWVDQLWGVSLTDPLTPA